MKRLNVMHLCAQLISMGRVPFSVRLEIIPPTREWGVIERYLPSFSTGARLSTSMGLPAVPSVLARLLRL